MEIVIHLSNLFAYCAKFRRYCPNCPKRIFFDKEFLLVIERTFYAEFVLPENMRVNHRRCQLLVSEQILNGANILPVFEQMRGKRMAKRMRAGVFYDTAFLQRDFKGFLQTRSGDVMSADFAGARIGA